MDPDLVGPAGFEPAGEEARNRLAVGAGVALEHLPMGHCLAAVAAHRHLVACAGVAAERLVDGSSRSVGGAPDEGKIAALERPVAAMVGELARERSVRLV